MYINVYINVYSFTFLLFSSFPVSALTINTSKHHETSRGLFLTINAQQNQAVVPNTGQEGQLGVSV